MKRAEGLQRGDRTHVIYIGPDGTRFWLSGMRGRGRVSGLRPGSKVELARGIVGLDRPPTELVWLQEAHQNGADLVGSNVDVRTIRAAVNILGDTPRELRAAYHAWTRSTKFDQLGRLFFINSYSGVRYSDVLLGDSPSGSIDLDPALLRRLENYAFSLVAPNPFFKGYTEEFKGIVGVPNHLGLAQVPIRIRNLGDSYTYPLIRLPGPGVWEMPQGTRLPNARGEEGKGALDGTAIPLPKLKANEWIWLNPDPRVETIELRNTAGVKVRNLWAEMSGKRPRVKLPGDTSEIWNFQVKGGLPGAEAKVVVTPLYSTFM